MSAAHARRTAADFVSASRIAALMVKEMIQMRRDRLTFAMIIGVPILQLVLFGYAINMDPKRLPTLVVAADNGPVVRTVLAGMQASGYFDVRVGLATEREVEAAMAAGTVTYAITFPPGFERDFVRGDRPQLLVEADATDPAATSNALGALQPILESAFRPELVGPLAARAPSALPVDLVVQRRYNPEGITSHNIVPGLLGTILTMTTILMTALALTRERERGTLENLMAMPATPLEIMIGKVVPYIGLGFVQVAVILVCARLLFAVPMAGSFPLLLAATLLFIAANVTLGYTFSTVARTQMQAMQMTFFWFLPSILLSGFMFPFRGMPVWAQWVGEVFPLTHYLRIVRAIMLKGSGLADLAPQIWPLAAFWLAVGTLALLRYRRTLD
ncbi:ABC transporter permease [Prosthecomicrobium pneumaticum]|uniref:ABC-2 type transport system permease protein n=1 Tax=Prosthecomicrobium pneumaticum TaxID=81895 RepID=A0A7W9FL43_9HYPH|nr:ABC transporter permease [Prosthecomicrobium pneumaticum]MBB5752338.1 ABC-2 type transport system permease protein [Prosthecomicrobium pneumaticum]